MGIQELCERLDRIECRLLELIAEIQKYRQSDPDNSMNKARQVAEAICMETIIKHKLTSNLPKTLDPMINLLRNKEQVMPPEAVANADFIRQWGNIGSHFKLYSSEEVGVLPAIAALRCLVEWFFESNQRPLHEEIWEIEEDTRYRGYGLLSNMPMPRKGFVGREQELEQIHRALEKEGKVFLCGMGGIGKSQLAKQYAVRYAQNYRVWIFANYAGSLKETIASDEQLPIIGMERGAVSPDAYFRRKMDALKELADENVLLIIDNFDVTYDEDLAELMEGDYKLIITSRTDFGKDGHNALRVGALKKKAQQKKIFFNHYEQKLTREEKKDVDTLLEMLDGHTMAIEIVAKQMMMSCKKPKEMIEVLQKGLKASGIRETISYDQTNSGKTVSKDQKKNSYEILKMLFSLETLSGEEKSILSDLALVPNSGIDRKTFYQWCELESYEDINQLIQRNWILHDAEEDVIHLHPLVSEVVIGELVKGFPYESRMMKNSFYCNFSEGRDSWIESPEILQKRKDIILRIREKFPEITGENEDQYFVMAITLINHGGYRERCGVMLEEVARERFKKFDRYDDKIFEIMFHLTDHSQRCRVGWEKYEKLCDENIQYLREHDQHHMAAQFCMSLGYKAIERGDADRIKRYMELAEGYYLMISPEKDRCGRNIRANYHPIMEVFGGKIYHFVARCLLALGEPEQALTYEKKAEKLLIDPEIHRRDERAKANPEQWLEMNRQSVSGAFGRIYEAMGLWEEARKYALEKEDMLLKYRHPTHHMFMTAYQALIRIEQHLGNTEKVTEYKKKLKKLIDANYLPEEAVYRRLTAEYELDE